MAATFQPERPEEVANKVLRRAQVSKVRIQEILGPWSMRVQYTDNILFR